MFPLQMSFLIFFFFFNGGRSFFFSLESLSSWLSIEVLRCRFFAVTADGFGIGVAVDDVAVGAAATDANCIAADVVLVEPVSAGGDAR